MPKSSSPVVIKLGDGTGTCQDHSKANLRTQVLIEQDAYDASQISAENPFETYLGDDAQSHFDDLASQVKNKPPRLGELSKTYSFGSLTATHSGAPDWGNLLQADTPVWERQSSISLEGVTIADTASHFLVPANDTFGYNLFDTTPLNEPKTDSIFNIADTDLKGGGEPASFLSSIQKGTNAHQHARVVPRQDVAIVGSFSDLPELASADEGFTVSGLLFPADRGTLALLRWENNDTTNLSYSPASSVSDIESRVVAAINLSVGLEPTDNPIFIEGTDQFAFPSKLTGQYDLYEMQTGLVRADLSNGGAVIPSLVPNASSTLGSVRILREAEACYFGDGVQTTSTKGSLDVFGGAYSWNTLPVPYQTKNFLSYRMPMLASYLPSGIKTPTDERERFFSISQPASTSGFFETAGNYVTFGEDVYTFQVARFRHTVKYEELRVNPVANGQYKKGSFALVHFKTEDAFENLVRDGISPSEDDLWSVNFLNPTQVEHIDNVAVDADGYSDIGVPQVEPSETSISNPLVRPQINVFHRSPAYWLNSTYTFNLRARHPNPISLNDWKFKREYGYFTTISGVKYLLPKGSKSYNYDSNFSSATKRNNFAFDMRFFSYSAGDLKYPHYMIETEDAHPARKFNDPFSIYHVNFASLTGEDNLSIYTPTLRTSQKTQSFLVNYQDTPGSINEHIILDLFQFSTLVYPEGDTGFCSFSEGALAGVSIKDPCYHYDGIATSSVVLPNDSNPFGEITTEKVLYHSARLHSLIETATTRTVRVYFEYPFGANSGGRFFSIFRYDQEGFRIYQTLENLSADIVEVSSLNTGYGTDYPKYGASGLASHVASAGSPEATLEMVVGEKYYVEYGPNYTAMTTFFVMFVDDGDVVISGTEALALSSKKTAQGNSNNFVQTWDRLSSGITYGLNTVEVNSSGETTHVGTLPYPAFQPLAFDVNDFDMLEVEKSGTGLNYPQYGNFLETETGVISVQGVSGDLTGPAISSSLAYINAYNPAVVPLTRRPFSGLFTARKDTQERFLDESYRIDHQFLNMIGTGNLKGSGLPDGFSSIDLSIRDDSPATDRLADSKHGGSGFLRNAHHWNWGIYSGVSEVEGHAQVRGMPQLANNVLSGGKYGQPRRGVLTSPAINYQDTSYIPNEAYHSSWERALSGSYSPGQISSYYKQPDNSATSAIWKERAFSFVRAFDVDFSRSSTTENMAGTSRFKLRLVGLDFNNIDFQNFMRPITVYVKVPGLTTWLDVSRPDGEGPSKQSFTDDGAGCLISYQEGVLVEEAVHYLDLELEVGPNASFFINSDGEAPVLVRAVFNYGFHFQGTSGTSFGLDLFGVDNTPTNRPLRDRRGLIGIEILRMSNGLNFDEDDVVVL